MERKHSVLPFALPSCTLQNNLLTAHIRIGIYNRKNPALIKDKCSTRRSIQLVPKELNSFIYNKDFSGKKPLYIVVVHIQFCSCEPGGTQRYITMRKSDFSDKPQNNRN